MFSHCHPEENEKRLRKPSLDLKAVRDREGLIVQLSRAKRTQTWQGPGVLEPIIGFSHRAALGQFRLADGSTRARAKFPAPRNLVFAVAGGDKLARNSAPIRAVQDTDTAIAAGRAQQLIDELHDDLHEAAALPVI